ncbi:MAG: extracellular solute-binding protein, partial [Clostridia bacterium]|nr:extracellular solute-binding protein [Clostridia bacterium]
MRKISALLLALVMVVSMLTACGKTETPAVSSAAPSSSEPAKSPDAATPAPSDDLKGKSIVVGRWGGNDAETAAFAKMLGEFTAETGIKVEDKVYTDYNTQLKTDLIAGTAPDVFYVDAYMAPFFISQGVLAEIDPAAVEADKFYEPMRKAFEKDGKLYAVSKDFSTLALYYNKKWVSEADLPKTQEELYSAAYLDKIQAKLPKDVIALTYNQDLARLMDIMQIDGTDIIKDGKKSNLAAPTIEANIKPIFEAAKAKKIMTPADLGMGWNGEAFGNERCAMMIEGNWVLGTLKTQF